MGKKKIEFMRKGEVVWKELNRIYVNLRENSC